MLDELTVTLTEADFVEAYRPPPRRRRTSLLVLLLAAMLALLIVVLAVRYPSAHYALFHTPLTMGLLGAVLLCAALVIALIIAAPALRRKAARSTLATHPGMNEPIRYAFDENHFEVHTAYTHGSYPWEHLWDWREAADVIIVLPSPRNFYVLPKRGADPAALERLRSYLGRTRKHAAAP
ncbi:MAG: YcxB family protein [Croceibacterium sp.]